MRADLLHSVPAVAVSRAPVGVVIGDPCGVGPEVVAKAWASGRLHAVCRPVLIGSAILAPVAGFIVDDFDWPTLTAFALAAWVVLGGLRDILDPRSNRG